MIWKDVFLKTLSNVLIKGVCACVRMRVCSSQNPLSNTVTYSSLAPYNLAIKIPATGKETSGESEPSSVAEQCTSFLTTPQSLHGDQVVILQ